MPTASPYAGLADAVRLESDQPDADVQPCATKMHDELFELHDKHSGKLLKRLAYRIESRSRVIEGTTDDEGRTERVDTGSKSERLQVFAMVEPARLVDEAADSDGCF